MKLSLRWVCDHLSIDWKKIDVAALVAWFNTSSAEIETVTPYAVNLAEYAFGCVQTIGQESCELFIPEWKEVAQLSARTDIFKGGYYLVKRDTTEIRWASLVDFRSEREGLLPAFLIDKKTATTGSWKKDAQPDDYILEVDNKSITHRPDLWSHRGFAREIAPYLQSTLRKESSFLAPVPVHDQLQQFKATDEIPFSIALQASGCKRFAALYFDKIGWSPSSVWMGMRLLKIDQRPFDFLVDATNYVMLDMGQPLHAFDAATLTPGVFGPRMARPGEELALLGDTQVILKDTDMVIADSRRAVALAGIKGGADSGISVHTRSVLLEAGTFDGGAVRLTASSHKMRTDASARFEKELDPHQNVAGIARFVKLLKDAKIEMHHAPYIVSLGNLPAAASIEITQPFIEDRLGLSLKKGLVKQLLEPLGFKVKEEKNKAGFAYLISVPSYRATKDIKQPEDIVEELGRLMGYTTIPELLPVFERQVTRDGWVDRCMLAKNILAFSGHLREVQNYAFADNSFVKKIGWHIERPVKLANPLSEERTTLVDSLVVNLLQNAFESSANHDQLGFFEWARIWHAVDGHPLYKVSEQKSVAGIWYQRKGVVDFYQKKAFLEDFFKGLGLSVEWKGCPHRPQWSHKYQIADLVVGDKVIGKAGKISTVIMSKLGGADAFAFEIDAQAILSHAPEHIKCKPLPKYQGSFLDVSMMVAVSCTVEQLHQAIGGVDSRIVHIQLQDVFQKPEWHDTKSITFRLFIQDNTQAVSKELLEQIQHKVQKAVTEYGAKIR